jgi:hypothetical protein
MIEQRQKPVTVCELPEFRRAAERFMAEEEIEQLCDFLARNPTAGALIRDTGGVQKLRWALPGRGKRGGARTIYFFQDERYPLMLLTAYPKSTKDDLSSAERNVIARLVAAIKAERRER